MYTQVTALALLAAYAYARRDVLAVRARRHR